MSEPEPQTKAVRRNLIVGALVAGGLLLAGGVIVMRNWNVEPVRVVDAPAVPIAATDAPAAPAAPAAASETATALPAAEQAVGVPETDAVSLSLDLVRVDKDGAAVIAGQSAPDSQIALLLDGVEIASGTSDALGKFVILTDFPPSTEAQSLEARLRRPGQEDVVSPLVIVMPFGVPEVVADAGPDLALAAPEPPPPPPARTEEVAPVPPAAPEPVAEVAEPAAPPPEAVAPTVLMADQDGVSVLQGPGVSDDAPHDLALDAIAYDPKGEVTLSGRGGEEEFVRIYLDNQLITTAPIEATGTWELALPDVDQGDYTLRVDALDATGDVTARLETPFRREDAARLADLSADATKPVEQITVQPGNTLWAIAKEEWGDGRMYVRVFEANRETIKNPDLIYPGQVFSVPSGG